MQFVIETILLRKVPVGPHAMPADTIPSLQDAQPVEVSANTTGFSKEPLGRSVIVVSLPQMPVRSHKAPSTLNITEKRTEAVEVDTNSPKSTPNPFSAAVQLVIVIITFPQVPIRPHFAPSCSIPSSENAQTVPVATKAAPAPPEPAAGPIVMVLLPQMPIRTHPTPFTLVIAVQCAQSVMMQTNASVTAPDRANSTM